MAAAGSGVIGIGGNYSWSWMQLKGREILKHKGVKICCPSSLSDSYKTLRIQPAASQSEVKKAFRHLALQIVMVKLRGESNATEMYDAGNGIDEAMRGMNEPDWELWEEWMGWEGAGIRDHSSHINPYI